MSSRTLTPVQRRALFDILNHHEAYREIEGFKYPDACTNYGYPFSNATSSTSPILQMLLTRFTLTSPGINNLSSEFWTERTQGLLMRFGESGLSESYDKGAMGLRKTLSTASASILEVVARGLLEGVSEAPRTSSREGYDPTKATDLTRAWDDVVQEAIYGKLVDDMTDWIVENEDFEAHSPAVKAAVDYVIIHLATCLHHTFVLSPDGQYLLKLIDNVNKLAPWAMIKQTLRVSNAATLMSAMMKLMLTKMSLASFTNGLGLTRNEDDGQNLLQKIISLTASFDSSDFKDSAKKIEKANSRPSDEHLATIKDFVQTSRERKDAVRTASAGRSESIIAAIFESTNPKLTEALTESQHQQCLEYYSALLSVRDRKEITNILCGQPPDLFTQGMREAFMAFEPMIRSIHERVDLHKYVDVYRDFLEDFLKISRGTKIGSPGKGEKTLRPPTVDDYVGLLRRHRFSLYRWLHDVASKCPDICEQYRTWARDSIKQFRPRNSLGRDRTLQQHLDALFVSVPEGSQQAIITSLDAHAQYLAALESQSLQRMQAIADPDLPDNRRGPGVYLSRWRDLMDETKITPERTHGNVRQGKDVKGVVTKGKVGFGNGFAWDVDEDEERVAAPDVSVVVGILGGDFTLLLGEAGLTGVR